jgi:hypothetical protein
MLLALKSNSNWRAEKDRSFAAWLNRYSVR